jgi:ABC-type antimicrobial peptide transport system permease subunit
MLKNYFQIAIRNLAKNRTYSIINITGLAISLTASIMLLLWVWDELSFNRFHKDADSIYAVNAQVSGDGKTIWETSPAPLSVFAKQEIPAIENTCRVSDYYNAYLLEYSDKKFIEKKCGVADATLFTMFNFPLVRGNKEKPFADNHSVILSETAAKKYFANEDPLNKIIKVNDKENYSVTGIMKDMPGNSTINYDFIFNFEVLNDQYAGGQRTLNTDWGNFNYTTYLLLKKGTNATAVGNQLADIHRKNQPGDFNKGLRYLLQPITEMHLQRANGEDRGMSIVKIFFVVAIVILLIASINYVNLVTARAIKRTKEISVRKVVGARKANLFWQFMTESFTVFVVAMVIAVVLIYLLMPFYNELSGKKLEFSLANAKVLALFGCGLVITMLFAGLYPSLVLSSFKPALMLKGQLPRLGKSGTFRKALVVIQFTCSVVLIVSTVIIGSQLRFIRQKNLGFNKENVFTFNSFDMLKHYDAVMAELAKQPGVLGVTAANGNLMSIGSSTGDIDWEGKPTDRGSITVNQLSAERNILDVMNLKLVEGTGFTGTAADSSNYILNETAVKELGIQNPVGKQLTFHDRPGVIAGVVKDFHFTNMKSKIAPCVIFYNPNWSFYKMYVKTTSKDASLAIAAVEKLWKQYNTAYPFEYRFMDEDFSKLYKSDLRVGKLFNVFAAIAIIISCLGLFGLVTYTAETKVKEIGIRKTLGASVSNIVMLLSKDFLQLVVISFLISFPLAWYMMNKWLSDYAYRTSIKPWVFIIAGLAAFAVAFFTVCSKAIRAAQSNPVKSLRTE